MKKFALVTYFDKDYVKGARVMIKSFLENNPWFSEDIIIFDWGIGKMDYALIKPLYKKIVWHGIWHISYNLSKYILNRCYYGKNFQKFDIFLLKDYEKIVVIDADMVIMDDISELFFGHNDGFFVDINQPTKWEPKVPYPDTGLMVIDKKYLTKENYEKLLERMEKELKKSTKNNPTAVSNEYVIEDVFREELVPIHPHYRAKEVDDIEYKIIGSPVVKPWGNNKIFNRFRYNLPWDTTRETQKMFKLKKILESKGWI